MRIAWDLLPDRPTTRFAPAPTGFLHLGHLVNAIFVWGIARKLDGRVLLRIEDHDRGRSREKYLLALLEDLEWLGLEPDSNESDGTASWSRQSDRTAHYREQLARLAASQQVYGCRCSRRDIQQHSPAAANEELRYPGTCRGRRLSPDDHDTGVRLVLPAGEVRFRDALLAEQRHNPADQCGDLLLRDRLGNWTYQFCVTVDDLLQRVDLVVRGEDLLPSTGRQIMLGGMLGRPEPATYLHHPLILRPDGSKLSKANRDTGLRDLREAGWSAARLLGEAACRCGLLSVPREMTARDLPQLFGD